MNWTSLLANRTVQNHKTSRQEIDDLREIVKCDLADTSIDGLSDDRKNSVRTVIYDLPAMQRN